MERHTFPLHGVRWSFQNQPNVPLLQLVLEECARARKSPLEHYDPFVDMVIQLRSRQEVLSILGHARLLTRAWQAGSTVPRLHDFAQLYLVDTSRGDWRDTLLENELARASIARILTALCSALEARVREASLEGMPVDSVRSIISFLDVPSVRMLLPTSTTLNRMATWELAMRRQKLELAYKGEALVANQIMRLLLAREKVKLASEMAKNFLRFPGFTEEIKRLRHEAEEIDLNLRLLLMRNPNLDTVAWTEERFTEFPIAMIVRECPALAWPKETPMNTAISLGFGDAVIAFLRNGANVNQASPGFLQSRTNMYVFESITAFALSIVQFAVQHEDKQSPDHLYLTILHGEEELWAMPDVDARTDGCFLFEEKPIRILHQIGSLWSGELQDTQYTPLLLALRLRQEEPARRLVEVGANIHLATSIGRTAISFAAMGFTGAKGIDLMRFLLQHGADPNNRISDPHEIFTDAHPLLMLLAREDFQRRDDDNDLDFLLFLLDVPAMDIHVKSSWFGNVVTMLTDVSAATELVTGRRKLYAILRTLVIERHVDVNIPIGDGLLTPLMLAIAGEDMEVAHLFAEHGADVLAQDALEETAFDKLDTILAQTTGVIDPSYMELREELQSHMDVLG